jgi:predicted TIM-barrel fold metal-dependent hydrolase
LSKREYRIVNVGSHVNPPAQMWEEYFPAELRDRAPKRVLREFDGQGQYEAVILEGIAYRQLDSQIGIKTDGELVAASGVPFARSFSGGHAGQREPQARLDAQDQDGIDADVLVHPGYPIMLPKDRSTRWGMMVAFNEWLAEFCEAAPDRLIGIGEIPLWDIELGIKEAKRIAERGLKGVLMPAIPGYVGAWSSPADAPYTDARYRPLWRTLNELGLIIVVHADAAAATPGLQDYTNPGINMIINKTMPAEMIASMIVGNVFHDFPNLKLICVETGVGWMAHLVSWMDVLVKQHPSMYRGLAELPSETFHAHIFGSFLWDTIGVFNRSTIGVDNMMWCNDFPHSYGPWPRSIDQINKDMGSLDEHDRYKILAGNAVRVFNL